MNANSQYYSNVAQYYDKDAQHFEKTAATPVLKQIRESFRQITDRYTFERYLEIGVGIGLDIHYFADKYPARKCYGIDVSASMVNAAMQRVYESDLKNVEIKEGTVENIEALFPEIQADMISVYFGALNTVSNPLAIEAHLHQVLSKEGYMVLTFVNKWYMMYILKSLVKFRFKTAFKRLRSIWGGYSPTRHLDSRCYSYKDIKKMFPNSEVVYKRGYSILYPAWYEYRIANRYPKFCQMMWKLDNFIQKTPFWNFGEYSLYVFKKV